MHWQKITLVGVGLLGGSLGLALKQRGLAAKVDGYVRRRASIQECTRLGVVDHATLDLDCAVAGADLVVLCTPLAKMRPLAEQMLPFLKPGAIVTDVGSVKSTVARELEPLLSQVGAFFVGSHPLAGGEKMGVSAARADLFQQAICVVTPTPNSSAEAVSKVEVFWQSVGARSLQLSPEVHDELVSRSSHLPHVVAAELANYVLSPDLPKDQVNLCATGFRDTTRIASSSPEMWHDIALANRQNLAQALGVMIGDLQEFRLVLERADSQAILEFFEQAKRRRDQWCDQRKSLNNGYAE